MIYGDQGKRVEHSGEIHFDGWNWGFGKLDHPISEAATEAMIESFKDYPPRLSLPATWGEEDGRGGPPVDDVLTIYAQIDAVGEDCAGPEWSFNLADVIDEELALHELIEGGLSEDGKAFAKRLADGLRALADKLETRLT